MSDGYLIKTSLIMPYQIIGLANKRTATTADGLCVMRDSIQAVSTAETVVAYYAF